MPAMSDIQLSNIQLIPRLLVPMSRFVNAPLVKGIAGIAGEEQQDRVGNQKIMMSVFLGSDTANAD